VSQSECELVRIRNNGFSIDASKGGWEKEEGGRGERWREKGSFIELQLYYEL
jgi:hypothetical protein